MFDFRQLAERVFSRDSIASGDFGPRTGPQFRTESQPHWRRRPL